MPAGSRVALLIDTSTTWGSRIIRGVAGHARAHGPWLFDLEPRGRHERLTLPDDWDGHGVLARVTTPQLADELAARRVPVVNVSWFDFGVPGIVHCTADEVEAGTMAARHLLDCGLRRFAYVGPNDRPGYRDRLGATFAAAVAAKGLAVDVFAHPPRPAGRRRSRGELDALARWLRTLPKPVGLFAWSDAIGRQVTEAARHAGLRVPHDVAVVGGEYDELANAISEPPLSSIDLGAEHVGRAAAEALDRMMAGDPPPAGPIVLRPLGVVARRSTDVLAVDDPVVRAALEFLRANAHDPIGVDDAAAHAAVSRRSLEQRFAAALGRGPGEELRRVRLDRACQLLADTPMKVTAVAGRCGFAHGEVFNRAFQRQFGLTPSAFRAKSRGD